MQRSSYPGNFELFLNSIYLSTLLNPLPEYYSEGSCFYTNGKVSRPVEGLLSNTSDMTIIVNVCKHIPQDEIYIEYSMVLCH